MSKTNSGLVKIPTIGNTSVVWDQISATQDVYNGTYLPKSFNINTSQGQIWTHGNATEHIYEAISSIKNNASTIVNTNPKLYTQFVIYDYWKSLDKSIHNGVKYNKKIKEGHWEFILSKPRNKGQNPVVKHALFLGLSKGGAK